MALFGKKKTTKQKLQATQKKEIEAIVKKVIQASSEGSISDITSTSITGRMVTDNTLKKNAYPVYQSAVQTIYNMYNGTTDFGSEFLGSIADTRTAFIAGGGITVIAEKKATADWITKFLKDNKLLEGSKLFESVLIGESEGKDLLILVPDKKTGKIKVRNFYCAADPYLVTMEENDNQKIKEVVYKSEEKEGEKVANNEHLVYIKLGGSPDKVNITMPKIGKCLSQIENASRILYDLRYNNHLYGRLTPSFKTTTPNEAKALNSRLLAEDWKIGKAYCGTAEFGLVGPPDGATEALVKELQTNCRIISINTGIPIHWLSWPDLMSNRSTAENLLEVISAATIMEREIWEEALIELVQKAMEMAFLKGLKGYGKPIMDPDGFDIKLPLISIALLKQIQETWIPLEQLGYITKDEVRNKIPGINPLEQKKLLEKEAEEKINNKFKNNFDHNHPNNNNEEEDDMSTEEEEE